MSRTETAIFTNLCMVYDDAGNILVLDRKDPSWPGSVFPAAMWSPANPLWRLPSAKSGRKQA